MCLTCFKSGIPALQGGEDVKRKCLTIESVCRMMLKANWHAYQVLTKRCERMLDLLEGKLKAAAEATHMWWGVSVENRRHGIPRIDYLRRAPVQIRFLSIEPLLEDLGELPLDSVHWVIVGGESGPKARLMQADWVRSIRRQCESAGLPFFFKQWGGVRKHENGRQLDGHYYDAMPMLNERNL